jgi:hypothetical protein
LTPPLEKHLEGLAGTVRLLLERFNGPIGHEPEITPTPQQAEVPPLPIEPAAIPVMPLPLPLRPKKDESTPKSPGSRGQAPVPTPTPQQAELPPLPIKPAAKPVTPPPPRPKKVESTPKSPYSRWLVLGLAGAGVALLVALLIYLGSVQGDKPKQEMVRMPFAVSGKEGPPKLEKDLPMMPEDKPKFEKDLPRQNT